MYFKAFLLIVILQFNWIMFISHLLQTVLARWSWEETTDPPGRIKDFKGFKEELILSISFSNLITWIEEILKGFLLLLGIISFGLFGCTKLDKMEANNMEFESSMRQFHMNPSTTIPNDQKDFLKYCYGNLPSEKPLNVY